MKNLREAEFNASLLSLTAPIIRNWFEATQTDKG